MSLYTPQRLFGDLSSSSDVLSHEPFLERARLQREQERDGAARLALGAYVVARLIDRLLTLDTAATDGLDSFRWQLEAVRRHVAELPDDAPETAHLAGIVAAISPEGELRPGLRLNLTAYSYALEHDGRFAEALEMLALAARTQGSQIDPNDFMMFALGAGRLNRLQARWEAATASYAAAEEAGVRFGDPLSVLRGRLGRGAVHRGQGNYPLARATAENVLRDAIELGITEAQAMAYADLGVIYNLQGLRLEALEAHYKAFRLTPDPMQRMRTLGDLALGLHEIGAFDAARIAFQIVAVSNASAEVRANALLELMDLESAVENRVAFERYRAAAEEYRDRMSSRMAVDYQYKLAVGLARFGQTTRARLSFESALQLAERDRINDWYFKITEAIQELSKSSHQLVYARQISELSAAPAVREMEVGLREYALAAET